MAWAMPVPLTGAPGPLLTFVEADTLWRLKTGNTASPESSDNGQAIARAAEDVYGDLIESLPSQGWSVNSIEIWLTSPWGKAIHLYCAAALFLRDKIPLDDRFWSVARTYQIKCEKIKEGKLSLRDENGVKLPRDTGSEDAARTQARFEIRNQREQENHDFYIDTYPGQFHGNNRLLARIGRLTFGNNRTGGRR